MSSDKRVDPASGSQSGPLAPSVGISKPHLLLSLLIFLLLVGGWLIRLQQQAVILHLDNTRPLIYGLLRGDIPPGDYNSPSLGGTGIAFGGPMLDLLHLPVGLVGNPILGMHLTYAFYELVILSLWLVLGLRNGLRPALVWTSAVIMAACPALLGSLAENSVLCGYMHVPFFMILVLALAKERAWAYMLSGCIFGLCAAVHLAVTLLISPACLLSVVLARQRMPRLIRLSWFGAGLLPVVLLVLPFSTWSWPIIPGMSLPDAYGAINPMFPINWVKLLIRDPFWIVGIGLITARRLGGIRPAPHELLAALWMLIGMPLHALAFSTVPFGSATPEVHRMVALLPGHALLDAITLTWLADWIRPRLLPRILRRAKHSYVLIAIALFMVVVLGKKNLDIDERMTEKLRLDPQANSQYHFKYFDDIQGLPWTVGEEPIAVLGHEHDWNLRLLQFVKGGTQRFTRAPALLPSRCVIFLGVEEMPGPAYPKSAQLVGGKLLSMEGTCLAFLEHPESGLPFDMKIEARPAGRILVQEEPYAWPGHPIEGKVEVRQSGKKLDAVYRVEPGGGGEASAIYQLQQSMHGENKVILRLPPRREGWRVWVIALD